MDENEEIWPFLLGQEKINIAMSCSLLEMLNQIFEDFSEHAKQFLHWRPITETNKKKLKKLEKKDYQRRFD